MITFKQFVTEVSKKLLARYINRASMHAAVIRPEDKNDEYYDQDARTYVKRVKGARRAAKKIMGTSKVHATEEASLSFKAFVEEGARLLKTYSHGDDHAKVYRDAENDEFHVKYFKNGKHLKKADSFHSDKEDAHGTAQHQVKDLKEHSDLDEGKRFKTQYGWAGGGANRKRTKKERQEDAEEFKKRSEWEAAQTKNKDLKEQNLTEISKQKVGDYLRNSADQRAILGRAVVRQTDNHMDAVFAKDKRGAEMTAKNLANSQRLLRNTKKGMNTAIDKLTGTAKVPATDGKRTEKQEKKRKLRSFLESTNEKKQHRATVKEATEPLDKLLKRVGMKAPDTSKMTVRARVEAEHRARIEANKRASKIVKG